MTAKRVRECILHIGLAKTGSTSIQETLVHMAEGDGWAYPPLRDEKHSDFFFLGFAENGKNHEKFARLGLQPFVLDQMKADLLGSIARAFETARHSRIILSSEGLPALSEADLVQLRAWLLARADRIRVFGFVRPPVELAESVFQQQLKVRVPIAWPKVRRFRKMLRKFDDVFGCENVTLMKFDPKEFVNGCAVQTFSRALDLNIPTERILRRNEGMSASAAALLYVYRQFGPELGIGAEAMQKNRRLCQHLIGWKGEKLRFAGWRHVVALAAAKEDVQWAERRLQRPMVDWAALEGRVGMADDTDFYKLAAASIGRLVDEAGIAAPATLSPKDIAMAVDRAKHALSDAWAD